MFLDNNLWSFAQLAQATYRNFLVLNHISWPSYITPKMCFLTTIMDICHRQATKCSLLMTRFELSFAKNHSIHQNRSFQNTFLKSNHMTVYWIRIVTLCEHNNNLSSTSLQVEKPSKRAILQLCVL